MGARSEAWKDCAKWLTLCGVLREDHKSNWPDSVASDLAMTLRDGTILCSLVMKVEPNCIDSKDVNQKPRMAQFLCLRNIKLFLQACHETFGLKESDLFEPQCLFDLTDFLRVLSTLSKLSQTLKFQRNNFSCFLFNKHRTVSQEDLYRNLSASEVGAVAINHEDAEDYSSHHVHMRNEEIYQDLCSLRRRSRELPISQPVNLVEKRDYVINELLETENNYVDVLGGILKHFKKPLSPFMTDEDSRMIFFGIQELYDTHTPFLAHLIKTVATGSKLKLSEAFLQYREKFLIYGDYIANLPAAQNRIEELSFKNDVINTELEKCQIHANNGKFKLRDILSVPMQRILKYPLLLGKLVSETQMSFDDYRGLERAKEAMVDVAQYINDVKRDSETLLILRDIELSIPDWIKPPGTELHHYGRLIIDGELRIKAHNDQKQKQRYVFVFDTVLVMCKAMKGDQYAFKDILTLADYRLQDIEKKGLTRDARWSHQWFLVHRAEKTAYTCYSRTEEFKRNWMKAITDALDNIEPPGFRSNSHKFKMHTYDRPSACSHCSKYLKGKIYQGYQCEKCQVNCHKMCLAYCGRCGTPALPPLLPPRLPSRSLTPVQLPTVPPAIVEQLQGYMWFVGEMDRETAGNVLENKCNGTYLVRVRPQGPANSGESFFALGIKADDRVKHMKVYERVTDGAISYFLSVSRFFKSLVDLVSYYEKTSLEENFVGLNITLQFPIRQLVVVAEFDYNPTEPNRLPLRTGCQLIVLSKEGDSRGWWRGTSQNREGFFPKHYVREISDTFTLGLDNVA